MAKFIQPVSMQVNSEQFDELSRKLKDVGYYAEYFDEHVSVIVTNYIGKDNLFSNISYNSAERGHRYYIDHYNPELFMALACMTDAEFGIAGEWWVRICTSPSFTKGNLYKASTPVDNERAFIDDEGDENGNHPDNLRDFRKATKDELIQHLGKKVEMEENTNEEAKEYAEVCMLKSDYQYDYKSSHDGFIAGVDYANRLKMLHNIKSKTGEEDCDKINEYQKELDLVEILKDVPKGTKFYSPLCGEAILTKVYTDSISFPIQIGTDRGMTVSLTREGRFFATQIDGECMLFPSEENRDWSTYQYKKKKDYPIDTPMLCKAEKSTEYVLRFYDGEGRVFVKGGKSECNTGSITFEVMIPVDEFDFVRMKRKEASK